MAWEIVNHPCLTPARGAVETVPGGDRGQAGGGWGYLNLWLKMGGISIPRGIENIFVSFYKDKCFPLIQGWTIGI